MRFAGDSVVAFFGYPHAHEDAAERAVRAGLAIIEALKDATAFERKIERCPLPDSAFAVT